MDESDGGVSANTSPFDLDPITTPDKDDGITPTCEEEINCTDALPASHCQEEPEQTPGKPRTTDTKNEEKSGLPSDDDFIRLVLGDLGITFTFTTIPCVIDVASCLQKTPEGIFVLSGLMKIDLMSAMDSLLNKVAATVLWDE